MWEKWEKFSFISGILHILALSMAFLIIFLGNALFYLVLNLVLFLIVLFVIYISKKNSKSKTHKKGIYPVYLLLSFFWILNVIDILLPSFFQTTQIFVYLASSGLFLLMLYKVLKKAGN
jgi:hypothetical protein